MSRHCFTYGSLMCADIMARVCGGALNSEAADLHGYSRHPVCDADYPGILPHPHSQVAGRLYRDLPESAWAHLDAFEGEMYARQQVTVQPASGPALSAWTYVVKPEFSQRLTPGDWDFDAFLSHGKARFEARYLGFEAL
jgi:gamma-glutamylcyclotransferase (GGCT)/AIG2-like uncharacterized protein YtfP